MQKSAGLFQATCPHGAGPLCIVVHHSDANNRAHVLLLRPMKPREYDQVIMQEWQIYGIEPSAGWFTLTVVF